MVKYIAIIVLLLWSGFCAGLEVVKLKTDKNITVFFHKFSGAKSVSISAFYHGAGSIYYQPGTSLLLSHCFEKCDSTMDGSKASIWDVMKENRFSFNSLFSKDHFFVTFTFLKEQLPIFIKFAKARLFSIKFDDFENIKNACMTEQKAKLMSEQGMLVTEALKNMFPKHPYGITPTDEDIAKRTLQNVTEAYKDLLTNHEFSAVVSGDLTDDEVKNMVDQIFVQSANLNKDKKKKSIPNIDVHCLKKNLRIDYKNSTYETSHKYVFAYMPYKRNKKNLSKQVACENILNSIISKFGNPNSLLSKLRFQGLVYFFNSQIVVNTHSSYITFYTETDKFDITKKNIIAFLKNLIKKGITNKQLKEYKEYFKAAILTSLIKPSGYASLIMSKLLDGIKDDQILSVLKGIDQVDITFFNNFLKNQIKLDNLSFVILFK